MVERDVREELWFLGSGRTRAWVMAEEGRVGGSSGNMYDGEEKFSALTLPGLCAHNICFGRSSSAG